jgi:hypothetical protein
MFGYNFDPGLKAGQGIKLTDERQGVDVRSVIPAFFEKSPNGISGGSPGTHACPTFQAIFSGSQSVIYLEFDYISHPLAEHRLILPQKRV